MSRATEGGLLAAALVATTVGGAWCGIIARRRRESGVAGLVEAPAIPPPFAGLSLPGSGDLLVAAISRPAGDDQVVGLGSRLARGFTAERADSVRPAWLRRLEDSVDEERTA